MNASPLYKLRNLHTRIHGSGGVGVTPLYVFDETPHFLNLIRYSLLLHMTKYLSLIALINLGSMKKDPDHELVKSKNDVDRLN
jgi:hypothetical protein